MPISSKPLGTEQALDFAGVVYRDRIEASEIFLGDPVRLGYSFDHAESAAAALGWYGLHRSCRQ